MNKANIRSWLAEPMPRDVAASIDRLASAMDVVHVAVMPDVHLSREVCVGVAAATTHLIYPAAVGGDIGCGMAAVEFDCAADRLSDAAVARRLLQCLAVMVPTNRHRIPQLLPMELAEKRLSDPRLESIKRRDGRVQFGTLGRGNHFLEFQSDERGQLWLMVHSGSRAVGPAIRDLHVPDGRLRGLDSHSVAGQAYLNDLAWARAYAVASRKAMVSAVAEVVRNVLNAALLDDSYFDCDHNHVEREFHFGRSLWIHRKGAVPAAVGEAGIIPGSMGTVSFHVEGRGNADALCSSSHGAGRAMSRDEARRRVTTRELEKRMEGIWFDSGMAYHLREESPDAYKDIRGVMRAQRDLTRIVRRLTPLLVHKGR